MLTLVLRAVAMMLMLVVNRLVVDGYKGTIFIERNAITSRKGNPMNHGNRAMSYINAGAKERYVCKASPDMSVRRLLLESFLVDRCFLFMETLDNLVADPATSLLSLLENGDVVVTGTGVNGDESRRIRGKWSIDENDNRLNINLERTYAGKYLEYTAHSSFIGEIREDAGRMMYIQGTICEDDMEHEGKFVMMPTSSSFKSQISTKDVTKMLLTF